MHTEVSRQYTEPCHCPLKQYWRTLIQGTLELPRPVIRYNNYNDASLITMAGVDAEKDQSDHVLL